MVNKQLRGRLRPEVLCAALLAVLAGLTLAVPDWIEALTGINPDGGDGTAERVAFLVLALLSLAGVAAARRESCRARRRSNADPDPSSGRTAATGA
jgi:hypothetical protein